MRTPLPKLLAFVAICVLALHTSFSDAQRWRNPNNSSSSSSSSSSAQSSASSSQASSSAQASSSQSSSVSAEAPSQQPLFLGTSAPPLMLLVMQRDHKLYYEAYNDATDLDDDGVPDVGFNPTMTYLGYFDSNLCYSYSTSSKMFIPAAKASDMKCDGSKWSGNFMNYLTTSRMDALRRVLYGGSRYSDTASSTILQRAYIPQDAHSWGKEYNGTSTDGYDISDYTPLSQPSSSTRRHLFVSTSLSADVSTPLLRVRTNSTDHFYNWVSKETPVAGDTCATGGNNTHTCTGTLTDYVVRVQVCVTGLLDDVCTLYPSGDYKPTGLLQKYGANDSMHFGLLTGSYQKNLSGGVLRKNVGSFTDEIDSGTGQFKLTGDNEQGIVNTIDRLAVTGYSGTQYSCGWITTRVVNSGECQMWGNPIGEMMYEAIRYFGGASATSNFLVAQNAGEEATLKLPVASWKDPYESTANGGIGEKVCSKPFMMVISDINPSYDSDELPGAYSEFKSSSFSGTYSTLDVSTEADKIWAAEGLSSGNYFIGQSGSDSDNAPTAKSVSGFSSIRGLAPEEPTKRGSFYSAAVAEWARTHQVNALSSDSKVQTFAIVMASPLPRISIPIGSQTVTVIPFAKSVGGSSISASESSFQPTNQLVDYYITSIKNTSTSNADSSVNGGRPYYQFMINYEDVEQGADHDMDAIAQYTVYQNADNTVTVQVDSTYAAGGIIQHMGYIVSGSTADGTYLVVRDYDTSTSADPNYYLDSPNTSSALPLTSTKTFTAGSSGASFIPHDPLWYAAKWGGYKDSGSITSLTTTAQWDEDGDGTPDTYYLVTNPAKLYDELDAAFNEVVSRSASNTLLALNSSRLSSDTRVYQASFNSSDWTGELSAYSVDSSGTVSSTAAWSAASQIPAISNRKVFSWKLYKGSASTYTATGITFEYASLSSDQLSLLGQATALGTTSSSITQANQEDLISYIKGDQSNEGTYYRSRDSLMGDIVDSDPTFGGNVDFGYDRLPSSEGGGNSYLTYLKEKVAGDQTVYVGANDGMLHAINAETGAERFTFIPNGIINNLKYLADTDYASNHKFFVDGPLEYSDAYVSLGSSAGWKSILAGTTGAGGQSVFALNVTDAANFTASDVIWEFTNSELGYTMSKPIVAKMENGRWAVITGNGPESSSGKSKLFIIYLDANLADSGGWDANQDYCSIATDDTTGTGLGGATVVLNSSGVAQYIYAGDSLGRMWRFNVAGTTTNDCPTSWLAHKVFTATNSAGTAQPITAAPDIEQSTASGYMVLFGTGRYYLSSDSTNTDIQSLYGILDPLTDNPGITRSDLTEQSILQQTTGTVSNGSDTYTWTVRTTSSNEVNYSQTDGWYMNLVDMSSGTASAAGERVLSSPTVSGTTVLFTTYIPATDACSTGGTSWLMALDYRTGASLTTSYFDLNSSGTFDSNDSIANVGVASGIQFGFGGAPATLSSSTQKYLLKPSDGDVTTLAIQSGRTMASWRQVK